MGMISKSTCGSRKMKERNLQVLKSLKREMDKSWGCHRSITITDPPEYAQIGIGPEYERLGMMGTHCLIDDPKAVARANEIANKWGLDSMSSGAMVGFAMECFEQGWITTHDTGGV